MKKQYPLAARCITWLQQSPRIALLTTVWLVSILVSTSALAQCPTQPTITANGPLAFCSGSNVRLQSSTGTGVTWLWSTGATTRNLTVTASGSYTVRTIANGCTSTASLPTVVSVTTLARPTITASGPTTFCTGGSVTLSAPTGTGFTWLWSTGETTQSITHSTSGGVTVRTIASGCTSAVSTTTTVTVNTIPTAPTITASGATTFCSGSSVNLTSSATSGNIWSTNATTRTITASTAGSYTVRRVVTGCTSAVSSPTVVTVNTVPTPTITAGGPTTFCGGSSVRLTSSATSGNLWSTSATSRNITVNSSGSYTVQRVVSGCTSAVSAPTVVTVNTVPTPTITPSGPTSFCSGGSVTLTSSTATGNLWSTGATTQSITRTTSGSITLRTIANGCTSTASPATVVTVTALPTRPTISASPGTTICAGTTTTLTTSTASGVAYLWSNGETTRAITTGTAGGYTVRTIANGCSSTVSATTTVAVTALPATPTISALSSTDFCTGGSVTLRSSNANGNLWSTGATTRNVTISTAGSYTVRRIANGCTSLTSAATVVNVTAPPSQPTITPSGPTTFCSGGSVTLSAPSGFSYLWSTGLTTQSITATTAGTYTVRTISAGCTSVVSTDVTVVVNVPPSKPAVTTSGTTLLCPGNNVTLTGPAGFSYLWSNGATTQSITVTAGGSYTLQTIANSCTSAVSDPVVVTNVTPPAKPTITAGGSTNICQGGVVLLSTPAGFQYLWSTGETTQTIAAGAAGNYTVQTLTSGCPSPSSDPINVTVSTLTVSPPTITASGPTTICTGQTVRLTTSATSGILWSTGNTGLQTIVINSTGSYFARTVVGPCTTAASNAIAITVIKNQAPIITSNVVPILCGGSSVTLTSSFPSGNIWSTGETTQSITTTSPGNYTVQGITQGCSTLASSQLVVLNDNNPPAPSITVDGNPIVCSGSSVRLTSSANYGNLWSIGNYTFKAVVVNTSGTYTVRQVVGNCTTAASAPVVISLVDPTRAPSITASGPINLCGGPTSVVLSSSRPIGNVWSNGATTPSITVSSAGTFTVQQVGPACASQTSAPVSVTACLPGNGRVGKDITLSIYPNPVTNGILNLTTETAMQHVKIYSIQGKLVYEQDLIGTEAQLRANLPAGTYTLLLSTETGAVHKLVSWE